MHNYFILAGIGLFLFFILLPSINYHTIKKQRKIIEKLIFEINAISRPLSHAWEVKNSPFFIKSIEKNETTIYLLREIKTICSSSNATGEI